MVKEPVLDKFVSLFKTKLLAARNIGEKNGLIDMTVGMENGEGNQTLYMIYQTAVEAKAAFSKLNNLKFDSNHRMSCTWINDLRGIIEEEENQINPEFK